MNILITSAGRRTTLLMAFKKVAHERNGMVLAQDSNGLAPALFMADKAVRLPAVNDDNYIECLLALVHEH